MKKTSTSAIMKPKTEEQREKRRSNERLKGTDARHSRRRGEVADLFVQQGPDGIDRVVGLDLGDRLSHACILSMATGEVIERQVVPTTAVGLQQRFGKSPRMRIVIEAGAHSPWVSRTLEALGHEILVGNPSRIALGGKRRRKTDRIDAEQLARIARVDPALLYTLRHRSADVQADLARLRARDTLVRARASLINHARGIVKAAGGRLPTCSVEAFAAKAGAHVPPELQAALEPVVEVVAELTTKIRACDRDVERVARERYPETSLLTAIRGVGVLTALAFVLTLEDPGRFRNSRNAGAYVGLVPRVHQSGDSNPDLRISKAGSGYLRRLLVQGAHYILGPFGEDCDLRRFGERLRGSGGKSARKRAIVAVARKLAVLMHRLWSRGDSYDPLYQAKRTEPTAELRVTA